MSYVISFFKWIWDSVSGAIAFVIGGITIFLTSLYGIFSSISALYTHLTTDVDGSSAMEEAIGGASHSILEWLARCPDIVKTAIYCLSIDTLTDWFLKITTAFVSTIIVMLSFALVSLIVYIVALLSFKYFAMLIIAYFPTGSCPSFIHTMASVTGTPVLMFVNHLMSVFRKGGLVFSG